MPKHEIPCFASPETHEIEVAGRTLRFYAVSSLVLLRLQQRLGGPFSKALDAMISGAADEARQAAIAELLEAAGKNAQAIGELVLDALHDEEWVERPASTKAVDAFLAKVDGPALAAMLAAVAHVNGKAFFPLAKRLLADLSGGVQGLVGSLTPSNAVES